MLTLFFAFPSIAFAGDLWGFMLAASCGAISSEYEAKVGAQIDAWRTEYPNLDRRLQGFSLADLLAKKEVKQMFADLDDEQMRKAKRQCDELIVGLDEELKQGGGPGSSR